MSKDRTPLTKTKIEKAKVPPGARQLMLATIVPGCLPGGSKTSCTAAGHAAARIHAGDVARGPDPAQQRAEERRRNRATLGKLLAETDLTDCT